MKNQSVPGVPGFLKLAVPTLLLTATLLVIATTRSAGRPAMRAAASSTQMAFFAYWCQDRGFGSRVVINNASNTELSVTPTLYSLVGQPLAVTPIVLAARQEVTANVADWLAQSGAGSEFGQGSLILSYDAPDAAYLGAQVVVANPDLGLSFDFRDEMPISFKSSRLVGLWWKPDGDSSYDLIVSNMENSSVTANIGASGGQGQNQDLSFDVSLAPHESRILSLEDYKVPFTTHPGAGKIGGISIAHTGAPGAVLACGILSKNQTGFSSHFPFEDPAEGRSQLLVGTHLLIDKPDLSGLPEHSSFTSIALLGNASDSPIEVAPRVSFSSGGRARTVVLSSRILQANQVEALDIGAELKRLGIRGAVTGCGLTLISTGQPGALVAHLTSFDQSRSHVFDVPMKDPGIAMNRLSGSYPWNIDDDGQSIIHVRNTADEKARLTIQLDFDGGSYTLPLQVLEAQQEVAVDIRQLRDLQTKDSIGRVIPLEVTHGQATWSERGRQALIGRMEVFSVSNGTSSSFSCGGPCCAPNTESIYATPDSITGPVGDGGAALAFEMQRRTCDEAQFGPFDITFDVIFWSSNTQVVTVSGPEVTYVGVGQADVNASFQGTQWLGSELNEICEYNEAPFFTSVPVTVFRLRIRVVGSFINFDNSDDSGTIVAGESFAIVAEAVNSVGNVLPVNVGVSTSASRTLDSTETGLPTTFTIVNGSYTSPSLLLNRVSGTNSGTNYRFSTFAGGFKDFFLFTYFRVFSTREGLVGGNLWCGGTVQSNDHFVSLPVAELCGVSVVVRNPTTGQSETTTKKDKGRTFRGPSQLVTRTEQWVETSTGTPALGQESKA